MTEIIHTHSVVQQTNEAIRKNGGLVIPYTTTTSGWCETSHHLLLNQDNAIDHDAFLAADKAHAFRS